MSFATFNGIGLRSKNSRSFEELATEKQLELLQTLIEETGKSILKIEIEQIGLKNLTNYQAHSYIIALKAVKRQQIKSFGQDEQSASIAQLSYIGSLFSKKGVNTRDARNEIVEGFLTQGLKSMDELTYSQASRCIQYLYCLSEAA